MHAIAWAALVLTATISYAGVSPQRAAPAPPNVPFPGVLDEHPAIRYAERQTTDPVARLETAVLRGTVSLAYEHPGGYLDSVLRALDISPESQLLVHSKTALQRAHTSPTNPRALYFNDTVVVGFIPGARHLEIAAHDREQGVIFYTIDQMVSATPAIARRTDCLTCHVSGSTLDVPGLITRSNFTDSNGAPIPQLGFHIVDHRTPLAQRWGGWFVTGKYDLAPYGGVTHLGNISTAMRPGNDGPVGTSNEILHRWLAIDAAALGYPSHDSDIAALMIFDHQVRAMNLLTRLGWEARVAAHNDATNFAHGEVATFVDALARYLLFEDEVPPPARLTPRTGFATRFTAYGPRDSRGRSLRELDLNTRLLEHGCSYMIYSPAFDALPAAAKQAVYRRMIEILTAPGRPAISRAVIEILRETKADWPSSR